jgi:hypothetical protein
MKLQFAAGVLLALAVVGCANMQPQETVPVPPEAQAQGVELTKEQGGRFIAFVGPKLQHTAMFLDVDDTNYFCLRSWLDNKTGETAHQLYVENSYYGGPFKWDGAHDNNNQPLRFIAISRNEISCENGCSYADEFAAALPEDYLRAHRDGLSVTFTAATGKVLTVSVPATLVTAELNAVDAVRAIAAKAKASASPAASPAVATPAPGPAPLSAPPPAAPTPAQK